ncbi:hypothetical protein ACROYT_G001003 [Oculina patagonica]
MKISRLTKLVSWLKSLDRYLGLLPLSSIHRRYFQRSNNVKANTSRKNRHTRIISVSIQPTFKITCCTARCSLLSVDIMKFACVFVLVLLVVSASSRDLGDRFQNRKRENLGMLESPQLEVVEDQEMQDDNIRRNDCNNSLYCALGCSGYYECSKCCNY